MDWKTSKCWYMMGWKSSEKQNEWSDGENPVLNVAGYFSCSQYRSRFLVACLAWAEGVVRLIFVNYSPWFSTIAGWINAIHLGLKCRAGLDGFTAYPTIVPSGSRKVKFLAGDQQRTKIIWYNHTIYIYIRVIYKYLCIYIYGIQIYMLYIYVHMEICLQHACEYCCWTSTSLMKPKNI